MSSSPARGSSTTSSHKRRTRLQGIANATLEAIKQGSYTLNGSQYDLQLTVHFSAERTRYYAPESTLSAWSLTTSTQRVGDPPGGELSIIEASTLEGARSLAVETLSAVASPSLERKIGVLNFASAKKPGGGFLTGAQAQEESIARSSTIYPTLITRTAQQFYDLHTKNPRGGYYSHAMIYSPAVTVFRSDDGGWVEPYKIDVVTSPAVNAGVVRRGAGTNAEAEIARAMKERMARILFLFEQSGVRDLVLGSFGTGVFRNNVRVVASIWMDLLVVDGARFKGSFDHVVFAILGRETYDEFQKTFKEGRKDTWT